MKKIFVDNHCHLFNLVDIPLYETLSDKVDMGTLKRLAFALGLGAAVMAGKLDDYVEDNKEFIRFFERSIEQNLVWLVRQIKEAIGNSEMKILITPLIMDFDYIQKPDSFLMPDIRVEQQLERLVIVINKVKSERANFGNVDICPFMGFDLRKLRSPDGLYRIQDIWEKNGIDITDRQEGNLESGRILGIKLYPPLGFNPFPEDPDDINNYANFYAWCAMEKVPVTTHCQNASGSYSVGFKKKEVNELTHAKNWLDLFEQFPQVRGLYINFAHFGGEEGLDDMIGPSGRIKKKSWTYYLIQLLKKYPNTYADISAFDFTDETACKNLQKVIEWDEKGAKFKEEGEYRLKDKLLWGSDVPMVISGKSYSDEENERSEYKHLFERFKKVVPVHDKLSSANSLAFLSIREDDG